MALLIIVGVLALAAFVCAAIAVWILSKRAAQRITSIFDAADKYLEQ